MALPEREEAVSIRKTVFTPSPTPPGRILKSRDEAHRLKEIGNNHFRKKCRNELRSALQCYTKVVSTTQAPLAIYEKQHNCRIAHSSTLQAIFVCPWPKNEQSKLTEELLRCLDPRQREVANYTLQPLQSRVVDGERGEIVSTEDCTLELLATCFGNRSAVLYDLTKIEVHH